MRALVKSKPEPGIWMERAARRRVGHTDLPIRVRKAAICGTDVHIYNWDDWSSRTIPVPMTVGHEFVGVIADPRDRPGQPRLRRSCWSSSTGRCGRWRPRR